MLHHTDQVGGHLWRGNRGVTHWDLFWGQGRASASREKGQERPVQEEWILPGQTTRHRSPHSSATWKQHSSISFCVKVLMVMQNHLHSVILCPERAQSSPILPQRSTESWEMLCWCVKQGLETVRILAQIPKPLETIRYRVWIFWASHMERVMWQHRLWFRANSYCCFWCWGLFYPTRLRNRAITWGGVFNVKIGKKKMKSQNEYERGASLVFCLQNTNTKWNQNI